MKIVNLIENRVFAVVLGLLASSAFALLVWLALAEIAHVEEVVRRCEAAGGQWVDVGGGNRACRDAASL